MEVKEIKVPIWYSHLFITSLYTLKTYTDHLTSDTYLRYFHIEKENIFIFDNVYDVYNKIKNIKNFRLINFLVKKFNEKDEIFMDYIIAIDKLNEYFDINYYYKYRILENKLNHKKVIKPYKRLCKLNIKYLKNHCKLIDRLSVLELDKNIPPEYKNLKINEIKKLYLKQKLKGG